MTGIQVFGNAPAFQVNQPEAESEARGYPGLQPAVDSKHWLSTATYMAPAHVLPVCLTMSK